MLLNSRVLLFASYYYSLFLLFCLLISGTGFLQANSGLRSLHFHHNHNYNHVSASSELASLRNTPQSLSQVSTVSGTKLVGRSIRSLLLLGGSIPLSLALSKAKSAVATTSTSNGTKKRLSDKREYKAIELENGLRVLLISDPTASRAAAAVDVHVGSFSDPAEVPGLAHFCEHMSFLGTKKYPNEDEFSTFLSEHGGSSNAYTDSEDTVYVSFRCFLIHTCLIFTFLSP